MDEPQHQPFGWVGTSFCYIDASYFNKLSIRNLDHDLPFCSISTISGTGLRGCEIRGFEASNITT
jgi:hypothetical protein